MASTVACLLVAVFSTVLVVVQADYDDAAETKIVGGHRIDISNVPWQVYLLMGFDSPRPEMCGGSILNHEWILTAAHCIAKYSADSIKVLAGTSDLEHGTEWYYVNEVVYHQQYKPTTLANDIGLLKTIRRITFNSRAKPVTLPSPVAPKPQRGSTLTVSGWGWFEDNKPSRYLRAVSVIVQDEENCRYAPPDPAKQICMGLPGKNFCKGDSGGPVMAGNVQVGVVSYMKDNAQCGTHNKVATYVTFYRKWITSYTGV